MVVIGVDFGNDGSRIATLQRVKIPGTNTEQNQNNVLLNESSDRSTPTIVTFQDGQCLLGEAAKAASAMHAKTTITGFKMLLGKDIASQEYAIGKDFCPSQIVQDEEGNVCAKLMIAGEEKLFSMQYLCSTYFSKLKEVTTFALEGKRDAFSSMDAVISVPAFFDQKQRIALIEAAKVAGLNTFNVVSDIAALAMSYGFPKLDLPANNSTTQPLIGAFVLVGHAYSTAAVLKFKRDHFEIVSHASTLEFSGRTIDLLLANHFASTMETKFGMEPGSIMRNPRWKMRMLAAAEHTKKTLSGVSKARFTVENINDADYSEEYTRDQLDALISSLTTKITSCGVSDQPRHPLAAICQDAIAASKCKLSSLSFVELTGGSSRVPFIKQLVEGEMKHTLSFTFNAEESIAKGCLLIATRLSPRIKSREIHIFDSIPYNIGIAWVKEGEEEKMKSYMSLTTPIDSTQPIQPPSKPRLLNVFDKFTSFDITEPKYEKSVNVAFKRSRPLEVSLIYLDEDKNMRISTPRNGAAYPPASLSIPQANEPHTLLRRVVPLCTLVVNELIPLPSKDALPYLKPAATTVVQELAKQHSSSSSSPPANPNFLGFCNTSMTAPSAGAAPALTFERPVKVRICLNEAGLVSLDSAFIEEEYEKEERVPIKQPTPAPSPAASPAPAAPAAPADAAAAAAAAQPPAEGTAPAAAAGAAPSSATPEQKGETQQPPQTDAAQPQTPPSKEEAKTDAQPPQEKKETPDAPQGAEQTEKPADKPQDKPADGAAAAGAAAAAPAPEKKDATPAPPPEPQYEIKKTKKTRKVNLKVVSIRPLETPVAKIQQALDRHVRELNERKAERERGEAKNALESYLYDLQRQLDTYDTSATALTKYIHPDKLQSTIDTVNQQVDWISYEEEADTCPKEEFNKRKKALEEMMQPAFFKRHEEAERAKVISLLKTECTSLSTQCGGEDKAHIPPEKLNKVKEEIAAFVADIQAKYDEQSKKAKHEDLLFTNQDIINQFHTKRHEWLAVINTPKPKPKTPEKKPEPAAPAQAAAAGDKPAAAAASADPAQPPAEGAAPTAPADSTSSAPAQPADAAQPQNTPAAPEQGAQTQPPAETAQPPASS